MILRPCDNRLICVGDTITCRSGNPYQYPRISITEAATGSERRLCGHPHANSLCLPIPTQRAGIYSRLTTILSHHGAIILMHNTCSHNGHKEAGCSSTSHSLSGMSILDGLLSVCMHVSHSELTINHPDLSFLMFIA